LWDTEQPQRRDCLGDHQRRTTDEAQRIGRRVQHAFEVAAPNPAAPTNPAGDRLVARDRGVKLQTAAALVRLQFLEKREFVRTSRAVEQRQLGIGMVAQSVVDHRPERRDAGSTGDEQKLFLDGIGRKDEIADRTLGRNPRTAPQSSEMPAPSIVLEFQEELEISVPGGLFWRRRDRIRHPFGSLWQSQEGSLPGGVGKRLIAERQPDEPGGRGDEGRGDDLQDASGQNSLMLPLRLASLAQGQFIRPLAVR